MKKIAALLVVLLLPMLIGCSGGDGQLAAALNPFGFLVSSFNSTKNPTLTSSDVRSLVKPTTAGNIFAGTAAGLFSFDPNSAVPTFTRVDAPAIPAINKLVVDGTAGDFFICTDTGLKKYTAASKTIADVNAADFGGKKVLTIARQSDNILWVGLEDITAATNSVARINAGVVNFYGTAQGLTASAVADIYVTDALAIACGTGAAGKGGLFKFNSTTGNFAAEAVNVGLENGASMLTLIGSNWYAAGPDSGMIVSTNNRDTWTRTALQNCSPVSLTVEEATNALGRRYWIASEKGVYLSYNLADFTLFSTTNGLPVNNTNQIIVAGDILYSAHAAVTGGISRFVFDGN